MTALQTYTHLPTEVQAIRVTRPFVAVEKAVPRAHRVTLGSGAFGHFQISNPGNNYGGNAGEGDWIVRFPTGTYVAVTDEKFRAEYSVEAESNDPATQSREAVFVSLLSESADRYYYAFDGPLTDAEAEAKAKDVSPESPEYLYVEDISRWPHPDPISQAHRTAL